jgi:hypothetical protein
MRNESGQKKKTLNGSQSRTTRFRGEHEGAEGVEPVPLALEASGPASVSPLVHVYYHIIKFQMHKTGTGIGAIHCLSFDLE